MFEDIQELHERTKEKAMDKLKKARKDGKRAHFSVKLFWVLSICEYFDICSWIFRPLVL